MLILTSRLALAYFDDFEGFEAVLWPLVGFESRLEGPLSVFDTCESVLLFLGIFGVFDSIFGLFLFLMDVLGVELTLL